MCQSVPMSSRHISYYPKQEKNGNMESVKKIEDHSKLTVLFILVSFIVCSTCLHSFNESNVPEQPPPVNLFQIHKENIKTLQNKFLGQSNRTWKILKSSIHHVITSENPDRPAVIFMVLPNKNSHPMALCLAQHFAQDIDKVLTCQTTQTAAAAATYPFVDGDKFISYNTEDQKLKLDQSIETIVSDYNSVIISHLEKFHSKSVMLFHGLCDTTEAKYKRIAIIFLLETSKQIKDEAQLALYLENLWSDIDPVRIKPLLARLANNVIFLNPDESFEKC
ncbi:uncharacterized protein LOC115223046 [Argonauta hians]